MGFATIAFITTFALPLGPNTAPSDKYVAPASLAYIDGNFTTAMPVFREAAGAGNAMAFNILEAAYEDGRGGAQNKQL